MSGLLRGLTGLYIEFNFNAIFMYDILKQICRKCVYFVHNVWPVSGQCEKDRGPHTEADVIKLMEPGPLQNKLDLGW